MNTDTTPFATPNERHAPAVVVLTGATSGIGEATARRLVGQCDVLILLGPEPAARVAPLIAEIAEGVGGADRSVRCTTEIHYISADFTHLAEVAEAARQVKALAPRIDLLINDAGVPGAPTRLITGDGYERTLQVNALAPALLTRLLVPQLSETARIVAVGSSAHHIEQFDFDDLDLERSYTPVAAYARAKLAMVTWSSLLAEELRSSTITVVALCPGLNDTPLSAAMMGHIGGPPSHGAARVLFASRANVPSGSYLENDRVARPNPEAVNRGNRERLIQVYWDRLARFADADGRPAGRHGARGQA